MSLSGIFARIVALIGAAALLWRRLQGAAPEPAWGSAPVVPAAKPQGSIPTLKMPTARGWTDGQMPVAAPGLKVNAFAAGLKHPRWINVLPNGDVLIAESNQVAGPARTVFSYAMQATMRRASALGESANRITLLRDADGDGVAETHVAFVEGLYSPFGMALVDTVLYIANSDAVVRFPYHDGDTHVAAPATRVVALPAGTINHHWTKNLVASAHLLNGTSTVTADGRKLYVSVGSNSNVAENGIAAEAERAAIWEVDPTTGSHRVFASGLRNPVGMAFSPTTGALWVSVNERDELGSDLVPDYMTSVRDGGFYGWPYSYYGQHVDTRVKPQRPDLVATAIAPDYALGPHTASLGLTSAAGNTLGPQFQDGMFVGQHGSWNRKPRSGYKVIFVPFNGGRPSGEPIDVLTGFLNSNGEALGRPVGVAIDKRGALLVADDVGNTVWRVTAPAGAAKP